MTTRVTVSRTRDGRYRTVVTEAYSTPWYYGETVDQALRGAPAEVRAHAARVEALLARSEAAEVVIKDRGAFVEVELVYGIYRRVIPAVSSDVGDALDKLLEEISRPE